MWKKFYLFVCCGLVTSISLSGQCPDNDYLLKKYSYLKSDPTTTQAEKLNELLRWEEKMKACSFTHDSTHAAILQSIGVLYLRQSDYILAVKYTLQAIHIAEQNNVIQRANPADLVKMYYNLSMMFGPLNQVSEQMKALDSCATIAIRLNSISIYCLYSLYTRVGYFFDIGDYNRCISYATRCEGLAVEYAKKRR